MIDSTDEIETLHGQCMCDCLSSCDAVPMKGMQVFQTRFFLLQTVSITHELHCRTTCMGDDNSQGRI